MLIGAEEMMQGLRTMAALLDNTDLIPSTHVTAHIWL